jgi:hypothetical protein
MQTFRAPAGTREARALALARDRMAADLAGRTIWCASSVDEGGASARRLRAHLAWVDENGVATAWLCLTDPDATDDLVAGVRPDDIVVLIDSPTAEPAEAIRARGAHAVWQVTAPRPRTAAVDAYVVAARAPDGAQLIAALMPGAGIVAAKELRGDARSQHDGWTSLLADVVRTDRDEAVGGTLHARPTVPAR